MKSMDNFLFGHDQVTDSTFTQTNLVSDGYVPALNIDPNLINPWGVSFGPGGPFWVSDNDAGVASINNGAGRASDSRGAYRDNDRAAAGANRFGTPTGRSSTVLGRI